MPRAALGAQAARAARKSVPQRPALCNAQDFAPLRTQLLVLQPTPFCNIDCDYCYLPQRQDRSRMAIATVHLAARRLREDGLLGDTLTVVWHAGEPLVLPPSYYDEAIAAVADALGARMHDGMQHSTQISHAFQSNGTLVDERWCAFFLRHGVSLGISVDGPAALHDAHRRTRRGGGTHARVQQSMALLRESGVPFHAIAVVGAQTLSDPDGFYDWFAQQGITELGCNFDETEGAHTQSSLTGHDAAHAAFITRLLQRSRQGPVVIRELAAAWAAVRAPLPRWRWVENDFQASGLQTTAAPAKDWPCNAQTMPLALVTVAHDGDFGTFSPELLGQPAPAFNDFVLGNVAQGGYVDALQGDAFQRLWQPIAEGIAACERSCAHFAFCGGGAPANKFYENGSFASAETLHCRAMVQRPFDAVLQAAEADLHLHPQPQPLPQPHPQPPRAGAA